MSTLTTITKMTQIIAEYIWLDAKGGIRSKTKVLFEHIFDEVEKKLIFPEWNYDGSSTGQATGNASEIVLKPVRYYLDPIRQYKNPLSGAQNNYLVLCETYCPDGTPHSTNHRHLLTQLLETIPEAETMFGFEQEFFLVDRFGNIPAFNHTVKMAEQGLAKQGQYYCGVGEGNVFDRAPVEDTMEACLRMGLSITGMNAEVAPSQWELQVCEKGVSGADQLIMLRYILGRTLEKYQLNYDISPKPLEGDWNGSGCHTNFSTKAMREGDVDAGLTGYDIILSCMDKLKDKHQHHMAHYGLDNQKRMTGGHETSSYDEFTYGLGNRGCSVRIPNQTLKEKKGYFEDRRPGSNMDPYIVSRLIVETCCVD